MKLRFGKFKPHNKQYLVFLLLLGCKQFSMPVTYHHGLWEFSARMSWETWLASKGSCHLPGELGTDFFCPNL